MNKLTSRKLWIAIAGIVAGIAIAFGVDASEIETVAGAVLSLISAVTYILTEGKVDAERVKQTIIEIQDALDVIDGE